LRFCRVAKKNDSPQFTRKVPKQPLEALCHPALLFEALFWRSGPAVDCRHVHHKKEVEMKNESHHELLDHDAPKRCELNKSNFVTVDLQPNQAATILVQRGNIWATMEGDPVDYVIGAGDRLSFSRAGRVVIEALEISDLTFVVSQDADQQFDSPELAA
jgi:hypothetical protein